MKKVLAGFFAILWVLVFWLSAAKAQREAVSFGNEESVINGFRGTKWCNVDNPKLVRIRHRGVYLYFRDRPGEMELISCEYLKDKRGFLRHHFLGNFSIKIDSPKVVLQCNIKKYYGHFNERFFEMGAKNQINLVIQPIRRDSTSRIDLCKIFPDGTKLPAWDATEDNPETFVLFERPAGEDSPKWEGEKGTIRGSVDAWEQALLKQNWTNADINGPFWLTLDFYGVPNLVAQSRELIIQVNQKGLFGKRTSEFWKASYRIKVTQDHLELTCRLYRRSFTTEFNEQLQKDEDFKPFDITLCLVPLEENSPTTVKRFKAYFTSEEQITGLPNNFGWRPTQKDAQELFSVPKNLKKD